MTAQITVLASGSSGNAALVTCHGRGLLIDCGVGPRDLVRRLALRQFNLKHIDAVLLTHTHSDHWKEETLSKFLKQQTQIWCHPDHSAWLGRESSAFVAMMASKRVHTFGHGAFSPLPGWSVTPLPVRHDSKATVGFRIEGPPQLFGPAWTLGYAADLGCWDDSLARQLANVDVLAIEFNHDVDMQRNSGRPDYLIRRVLGDEGHLSNLQAAELVQSVLQLSVSTGLRCLIPLHVSRQCNRASLVAAAAETCVNGHGVVVHVARQHEPLPSIPLGTGRIPRPSRRGLKARTKAVS